MRTYNNIRDFADMLIINHVGFGCWPDGLEANGEWAEKVFEQVKIINGRAIIIDKEYNEISLEEVYERIQKM